MKSFISEDDIEQAICHRLSQPEYGWTRIECDPSVEKQDDVSATGRSSVKWCWLQRTSGRSVSREYSLRINHLFCTKQPNCAHNNRFCAFYLAVWVKSSTFAAVFKGYHFTHY